MMSVPIPPRSFSARCAAVSPEAVRIAPWGAQDVRALGAWGAAILGAVVLGVFTHHTLPLVVAAFGAYRERWAILTAVSGTFGRRTDMMLTHDGFGMAYLGKLRSFGWESVSEFTLVPAGPLGGLAVCFSTARGDGRTSRLLVPRAFSGFQPEELAEYLNAWRTMAVARPARHVA